MAQAQGTIVQCIGAVTDIQFDRETMPNIYDALLLVEDPNNPLVEKEQLYGSASAGELLLQPRPVDPPADGLRTKGLEGRPAVEVLRRHQVHRPETARVAEVEPPSLVGFDEEVHREHALAEIALVELALEHELVEMLKLGERELLRQELETDRLIAQLAAQAHERRLHDVGVVEREAREVVHAEPSGIARVGGGVHLMVASRWLAALDGRAFVTPDDVKRALHPAICHRLVVAPEVELDGLGPEEVIDRVSSTVEVPR